MTTETKSQPAWEKASQQGHAMIDAGYRDAITSLDIVHGWLGTLGEDTERLEAVKLSLEVLLRERQ